MTFPKTLIAVATAAAVLAAVLIYSSTAEARWFGRKHHDPEERAKHAAEFVLWKLDATDEQQTAVDAIIERTHEELVGLDLRPEDMHGEFMDALAGETVDRAALEALRTARMQDAEAATQLLLDALADAAEVLTPEQRAELRDMAGEFGDRHGRRGHGWRH